MKKFQERLQFCSPFQYQIAQLGSVLTIWKVLLALNQVMKCKSYSNNLFKQLRINNMQDMVFLKF